MKLGQGVPVFEQLPACRRTLPGTVPDQGACTDVFDCEIPLICPSAPAFGLDAHICQKPVSACVRSSDCPLGSICTGSSKRRCTPIDMLTNPAHSCSGSTECPVGRPCIDTFCGAFWPGEPGGTACGPDAPSYVECSGYCEPASSVCRPFCAPQ